jgi:hypothetical protein
VLLARTSVRSSLEAADPRVSLPKTQHLGFDAFHMSWASIFMSAEEVLKRREISVSQVHVYLLIVHKFYQPSSQMPIVRVS